ncbi:MAG: serine protein kinase RIO [Candidatus Nanoarchaeia archaeon]|nr:serine protein kinase RIO [Candidatus Nanoarchaeia archaeon]
MAKTAKEKFKTYGNVFDNFTIRNLFELSSRGFFEEDSLSPVSIGKESNVFSAKGKDGPIILKIYRLETADFNRMYSYIRNDPRFLNLKNQRRKVIFAWVQREYRNLFRAREAKIRVPTPFAFMKNILIMEFIGKNQPALKLKDHIPKNKKKFYLKIKEYIKNFYKIGFVHGDLSEFNILNFDEEPVFIDLSHSTTIRQANSMELFERDVKNLCRFFNKNKLKLDYEKELKEILS